MKEFKNESKMSEEPKVMSTELNDYLCRIHEAISEARKSSYNIFAVFLEAYDNLITSEFDAFTKKVVLEKSSINKMIKICKNDTVTKYVRFGNLPESWSILYQITLLNDSDIDKFISDGSLNKNSTFKDVKDLRDSTKTNSASAGSKRYVLQFKESVEIDNIAKNEIKKAIEIFDKYFSTDGKLYDKIFGNSEG